MKEIKVEFLLCRDLTHSWVPDNAFVIKNRITRRREIHRVMRCERCSMGRTQRLSSLGEILGNSYSPPEGYSHKGEGRMTALDMAQLRIRAISEGVGW